MRLRIDPAGSMLRSLELPASLRVLPARPIAVQQLATVVRQIQSATRDAKALISERSQGDLMARLQPGSWSAAECFDHLSQTSRAFLPVISKALADAPVLKVDRPLRTGTLASLFIRNLEPPYRIRLKVLPQLTPQHQDFNAAWEGFLASQSRLLETISSAGGLAIDKVKIQSPVYARFSYNVYGAFRMLAAHQRRHLWQIEQIFSALDRERNCARSNCARSNKDVA